MTKTEKKKLVESAASKLGSARDDVQELRDDVDGQLAELSEKQQEGEKGEKLNALTELLEDIIGHIEDAQNDIEGVEW